ncbi:hypothetical protein [Herpetosiphon gulosus]|uniref:Uncharacterized protein n=1 Tax=Herpetosiphon gulosus TaxID=1973496 RepID=A0ABP9WX98_9CHLR
MINICLIPPRYNKNTFIDVIKNIFIHMENISIVSSILDISVEETSSTATLTSIMDCDRYGCETGLRQDTFGKMYFYDDWAFNHKQDQYACYYISNAIWKTEEPYLDEIIVRRLQILFELIRARNYQENLGINRIIIHMGVLCFWDRYSDEEQIHGFRIIRDFLKEAKLSL